MNKIRPFRNSVIKDLISKNAVCSNVLPVNRCRQREAGRKLRTGAALGCFLIVRPYNPASPGSAIRRIRAPYSLKYASMRIFPCSPNRTIRKRSKLRQGPQLPPCLPLPRYRLNQQAYCHKPHYHLLFANLCGSRHICASKHVIEQVCVL